MHRDNLTKLWENFGLHKHWLNQLVELGLTGKLETNLGHNIPVPPLALKNTAENTTPQKQQSEGEDIEPEVGEPLAPVESEETAESGEGSGTMPEDTQPGSVDLGTAPSTPRSTTPAMSDIPSASTSSGAEFGMYKPTVLINPEINNTSIVQACMWPAATDHCEFKAFFSMIESSGVKHRMLEFLADTSQLGPGGTAKNKISTKVAGFETLEWVPPAMRNNSWSPEGCSAMGIGRVIGGLPYTNVISPPSHHLPTFGIGQFLACLSGRALVFQWPMEFSSKFNVAAFNSFEWLCTQTRGKFNDLFSDQVKHWVMEKGCIAWIPYGSVFILVHLRGENAVTVVLPYFSSTLAKLSSPSTQKVFKEQCAQVSVPSETATAAPRIKLWLEAL